MSDFNSLSIKQLKQVLNARCLDLSGEEARSVKTQMSNIVEKGSLVSLCKEHVEVGDIQKYLDTPLDRKPSPSPPVQPSTAAYQSSSASGSAPQSSFSASEYKKRVSSHMGSPDQLRYSAACMRRDPAAFRRSNPEAAGYSDDQVLAMATNLEQMAADPAKLRAYQEQVGKMSDEDLERMQKMSQHVPPAAPGASTASNIDRFVTALQGDPKNARAMLKSMPGMPVLSDEMYDKQLEQLRQLDPVTIRNLLLLSEKIKVYYDNLDRKLGNKGYAKYFLYVVIAVVVILLGLFTWKAISFVVGIFFGSSVATEIAAQGDPLSANTVLSGGDAEFEF